MVRDGMEPGGWTHRAEGEEGGGEFVRLREKRPMEGGTLPPRERFIGNSSADT